MLLFSVAKGVFLAQNSEKLEFRVSVRLSASVVEAVYSQQAIVPGRRYDMSPADGSSTRSGSTSVRGRVRSPHMAKLQAASVPID